MTINCPVCDRILDTETICPNCETDLTAYQMLVNLSPINGEATPEQKKVIFPLWLTVAILALLLGLSLGFMGNGIVAEQPSENPQPYAGLANTVPEIALARLKSSSLIVEQLEIVQDSKLPACTGFYYVVRRGDSLSAIATSFYGDRNFFSLISRANSQLIGRENYLEIGEQILIPNLNANC